MRQFSIREAFALQDDLQRQQKQQESRDRARDNARAAVGRMFRPNAVSPGVSQLLENAVTRLERCREQDTDEYGEEIPSQLTRSPLDMGVHESVEHLPQRRGGFDISPEGRTDEKGRPLHYFHEELNAWIPIQYED